MHAVHRSEDAQPARAQDQDGTFSTVLFERYQRLGKALVLAMMEMYAKGVSTHKVQDIAQKLCGRSFSGQQASKLAQRKALFIGSLGLLHLAFLSVSPPLLFRGGSLRHAPHVPERFSWGSESCLSEFRH